MATLVVVSVAFLMGLGVAFGVGLALAAQKFRVETDPRVDEVLVALPGINCGSCGYAGCAAYAAAVTKGEKVDLCTPGGAPVAKAVATIMGQELTGGHEKRRAVVHCQGGWAEAKQVFEYSGVQDCRAAALVHGGPKACKYGCLGYGTCASVCPFEAILMSPNGLPIIIEERCTACGLCVKACPVPIMSILPSKQGFFLGCSNPIARGKTVKEQCARGCIKCRLCVKVTKSEAIAMEGPLPKIDYDKGQDFDAAFEKCPMNCYVDQGRVAAEAPQAS